MRRLLIAIAVLVLGCKAAPQTFGGVGPEPFAPSLVLTPGDASVATQVVQTTKIDGGVRVSWGADPGTTASNLELQSDGGHVCIDPTGGSCGTIAATGQIRSPNGFTWNARNAANSADCPILAWNSSDNIVIGSKTVPTLNVVFVEGYNGVALEDEPGDYIQAYLGEVDLAPTGTINVAVTSTTVSLQPGGNTNFSVVAGQSTFFSTIAAGYLTFAIANCNGTPVVLSQANSNNNMQNVSACTTGVTSTPVTSFYGPTAGRLLFFRNSSAATITYQWSSGSACTVLTNTSALLSADGTNCVKLMSGT